MRRAHNHCLSAIKRSSLRTSSRSFSVAQMSRSFRVSMKRTVKRTTPNCTELVFMLALYVGPHRNYWGTPPRLGVDL